MLRTAVYKIRPLWLRDWILGIWRTIYWRRKAKIPHKKNEIFIKQVLEKSRPINLELGSWKRPGMENWIASDIGGGGDIQLDLLDPLPFPDSSVDRIYSSHLLEHFAYPNPMLDLLSECYRVLKIGGEFSIAVPNARIFIDAYHEDEDMDPEKYFSYDVGLSFDSRIDYINFVAYCGGEHKHLFDAPGLVKMLEKVGYSDVNTRDFDPEIDLPSRMHESLYAIAIK